MAQFPSNFKFPILNANGTATSTIVDMNDLFVRKEIFLQSSLYMSGDNRYGRINNSGVTSYSSLIQIGSLTNWKQVSAQSFFSAMAVKTDGTLWAWGDNTTNSQAGRLGLGDVVSRSSPTQVGTLSDWKQVSHSSYSTYAIKTNGTLWAWGLNNIGQLGYGDTIDKSSPIQIGSLTDWKYVVSADTNGMIPPYSLALAIKNDGTLWGIGYNPNGLLGVTDTVNRSSPVQIGTSKWKTVAVAGRFSLMTMGVRQDGTLWTWGDNYFGQLGQSGSLNGYTARAARSSPTQVGTLKNWASVTCGEYTAAAVKTDGTLWTWGRNIFGELGLGDTIVRSSPCQVGSLTNWKMVSTGGSSSTSELCAIKTDGTMWFIGGYNSSSGYYPSPLVPGVNISSPVQISSLTGWKSLSVSQWGIGAIYSPDLP